MLGFHASEVPGQKLSGCITNCGLGNSDTSGRRAHVPWFRLLLRPSPGADLPGRSFKHGRAGPSPACRTLDRNESGHRGHALAKQGQPCSPSGSTVDRSEAEQAVLLPHPRSRPCINHHTRSGASLIQALHNVCLS